MEKINTIVVIFDEDRFSEYRQRREKVVTRPRSSYWDMKLDGSDYNHIEIRHKDSAIGYKIAAIVKQEKNWNIYLGDLKYAYNIANK